MDWHKEGYGQEPTEPEYEEFDVEFLYETEKAILIECNRKKIWLPKSQLEEFDEFIHKEGDSITVYIADWIVDEKEMG